MCIVFAFSLSANVFATTEEDQLWINETEINTNNKFYLGMTVDELLNVINKEGLLIDVTNPYATFTEEGVGVHQFGNVFVEAAPYIFWLDSENLVKYINISVAQFEAIRGISKSELNHNMSDKDIEKLFGLPMSEYTQGDSLYYLYKRNGYFLEFVFDIGNSAFEGITRDNWKMNLKIFKLAIDVNDTFSGIEIKNSPVYSANSVMVVLELTDDYYYSFPNSSKVVAPNDVLLMVNGTFTNIDTIIRDGRSYISSDIVYDVLEKDTIISIKDSLIVLKNDDLIIELTIGNKHALINGKDTILDATPFIADDTIYIPLRFTAEHFGKSVGYLPAGAKSKGQYFDPAFSQIGIAQHAVIWVDDRLTTIDDKSIEDINLWLKEQYRYGVTSLKNNLDTVHGGFLSRLEENMIKTIFKDIEKRIDNTMYIGQVGRYALFNGPYITLVDVSTDEIFIYSLANTTTSLAKMYATNPETFVTMYFSD